MEYYADGSVTSANRSAASRISTASLPAAGARRHLLAGDGGAGFRRLASGCGSEGPQGQRGARRLGVSRGRLCWLVLERVIRIRVGLRTVGEVLDRSATPPERRNQTASRAGRARSRAAGAAEAVDAVHQGEQRISEERDRLVRHGEDRADPGDRRSPRAPCTWFHPRGNAGYVAAQTIVFVYPARSWRVSALATFRSRSPPAPRYPFATSWAIHFAPLGAPGRFVAGKRG